MPVDQLTIDKTIDVSKNNPPEFGYIFHDLARFGSVTTSARLLGYVAQFNEVPVSLSCFPTVIASGTLKVDVLVNGVSICTTVASSTTADTPAVVAAFDGTLIEEGDLVVIATTSDSSTVTDVLGQWVSRPQFGSERNAG